MTEDLLKPYVIGLDLGGTNSVFGIVDSRGEIKATVKDGRLADVAPSILHIMGLEKPEEMTGENLICD